MRRVGGLAALVGAVALLAGCADGSPDDPTSPRGTVEALKDALVDADADALLAVLDDEVRRTSVSTALLTDEVLARGALAGQDVEVDKTDNSSLEFIEYTLKVDDTPWLVVSISRGGNLVGSVLPRVEIEPAGAPTLLLDDARVPVPQASDENDPSHFFFLPPGRFSVGVAVPEGLATATPPQEVVLDEDWPRAASIRPEVRLTDAGRKRVDDAVRAWVERCTEPLRGPRPADCPSGVAWAGAELVESRWQLDAEPTWDIESSIDGFRVVPGRSPTARMTGTLRDRATGRTEAVSDKVDFTVEGTVRLLADDLRIEVPGY